MPGHAVGTFEITLTQAQAELDGAVGRMDFTKRFAGELEGQSTGVMLSAGDPRAGEAGYIAMETVTGQLGGRSGALVLAQLGTMHAGDHTQTYVIVPGSGNGELAGVSGTLALTIESDGTHRYELTYEL